MTARALVLGAAGGIGRVAAQTLAAAEDFSEIAVADLELGGAREVADSLEHPGARPMALDVANGEQLAEALGGCDVVVNCVGPFYRFGPAVLAAAIEAGVDYVDVCDDLDATERQLDLHERAAAAGVRCVVGLGNSPGLANLLVRYAADHLLTTTTSADIFHIHGGEHSEGPAVIQHRIHAMVHDVPVFDDARFETVRLLEPSGRRFVVETEFRDVGTYPVFPYPHPETITLPVHIPGIRRVTNRGVVFPLAYFERTMEVVRQGLAHSGPNPVAVSAWTEQILSERKELLDQAGVRGPKGCLKVEVAGEGSGGQHRYVFSVSSSSQGAGAGTGIPAGIGAILMVRGRITAPGVHPPEAAVEPLEALGLAGTLLERLGAAVGTGGGAGLPLHLVHLGPGGDQEEVALGL